MFLLLNAKQEQLASFPHAGGDVSKQTIVQTFLLHVFPTQVGMFQTGRMFSVPRSSFPHAGGDVSGIMLGVGSAAEFSPRRWGCF